MSKSRDYSRKPLNEKENIELNIMYPDVGEVNTRTSLSSFPSSPKYLPSKDTATSRQVPELTIRENNRQLALRNTQILKNLKNLNKLAIKLWIQHVADRLKLQSSKRPSKEATAKRAFKDLQVFLFSFPLRILHF